MSKNGIKIVFCLLPLTVFFISGCVKNDTITIANDVVVTKKVSFTKDLEPLLVANCATAGCHVANRTAPNLEKGAALYSIKAMKLIDVSVPQNSSLYQRMTGKLIPAMPIGKASNPSNINNVLLAWIKQGALSN